jgi:cell division protein FtsI/penicillin-binding protein 2
MVYLFIAIFLIACRLLYLQISCFDHFKTRSTKNFLRYAPTQPLRGTILDRNGNPLATNRPLFNLWWKGSGKKALTPNQHNLITTITTLIPSLPATYDLMKNITQAERSTSFCLIARDLSHAALSILEEKFFPHPNIVIKIDYEDITLMVPMPLTLSVILVFLSPKIIVMAKWASKKYFTIHCVAPRERYKKLLRQRAKLFVMRK